MEKMTAQEAAEWGKTLDFPTVWAALMESREKVDKIGERVDQTGAYIAEMGKRVDQTTAGIAEMGKRVDQTTAGIAEMGKRFDRMMKNIGGLNRTVGELIETLVAARLWKKFPEYNLQRAYRRLPLYNEKGEVKAEIDILLVNSEWAMAVEVKREVTSRDVEHHLERMARILKYPPAELKIVPQVKLLGALAGGLVTQDAKEAAHQAGFYVLELAGEAVVRIPDPPEFKPKKYTL